MKWLAIILLGLAHGLADCISGFMLGSLASEWPALEIGAFLLLYNILGFGGQVPAGMLVDRMRNPRLAVLLSMGLVALSLPFYPLSPIFAVVLAGIGSAFFHVSGGMLALLALPATSSGQPGQAKAAGMFAAPGVMGLAIGGYLAIMGYPASWLLLALICSLALILAFLPLPARQQVHKVESHAQLDLHDILMLVLLLAIAMRSAIWNVFQLVHAGEHTLLVAVGLAAMTGKVAGGFASDWLGWRRYTVGALLLATPLLALGGERPWFLLPGVMLLQSATPAAVTAMWRFMPEMPATAVGMCFGMAIAIGGLPAMLHWNFGAGWALLVLPLAAVGYYFGVGKRKQALS